MKRFTLILSLLVAMVTTAMGQINYGKSTWTFPATSHEKVTEVPAEIFTDFATQYSETVLTNEKVGVFVTDVRVATEGDVTATFIYNDGNIRMDISGVDLINANGEVVKFDYHFGYTGSNSSNNTYTLSSVPVGDYSMRLFVAAQKEDITSATSNDSRGVITIAGWLYPEANVFYNIKNVRSSKYATFKGVGNQFRAEDANNTAGSYWYFVEASSDDVKKIANAWLENDEIPGGYKPYYVYNAACEKAVENVGNGYMAAPGESPYPAKLYYIGVKTNGEKKGFVLRPCNEDDSSWNDNNAGSVCHWNSGDPGSVWRIEPTNVTESNLIAMGTTAKNNALATVDSYQKAYYNNATPEQINTAKTDLNNIDCSTMEKALTSVIDGTANAIATEIANCAVTPAAGDRFMIKGNVQQNDYLIAAKEGNVKTTNGIGANDINALDLVWTLKAAEVEGKFYLYNERLSVYVAPLTTDSNGKMGYVTDEANAGVYSVELKGANVAFHADTQDGYGYIHHPRWNTKEVTRWEANDANSQWQLLEAPLELTTDIDAPICYAIKSGRDGNYYFTLENNKIKLINNQNIVGNDNAKWFFMLDESKNLKIYPYADKDNTMGYITVADGDTKLTNDQNAVGWVADTYTLYYNPNLAAKNNGKCFAFRPTEGNTFVSNHGGTGNYMGFYDENDDKGTRLGFENINKEVLVSKIEAWESYLDNEGDKVCQYVIEDNVKDEVESALVNAEKVAYSYVSNNSNYAAELTVLNAIAFPSINVPETGKYYRLKNHQSGWYATSDLRTGESEHAAKLYMKEDGSQANTIWYVGANNALLSYTKGQYLGDMSSDWSFEAVGSNGNATTFVQGATIGKIQIKPSSGRSLYGDKVRVDAAGEGNNSGNYEWTIEEVTTLPVTIKSVGFATFYAPVAVEIPENVKAYYLESKEKVTSTYISLTEIEGGVIPANTGVILEDVEGVEGVASTYDFVITDTDEVISSLLAGTVAAEYIAADAYVLSAPEGDITKLGLYTAALNKVDNTAFLNNSHKAYLPKDVLTTVAQNSNGFTFDFEGTTAIEDVNVEEAEINAIYDLQGRKVENPTKGIYIINGNKVIIK